MCRCNEQRAAYLEEQSQSYRGMVKIRLLTANPCVINGDVTGRMYVFRARNDFNWVDKRDAISMIGMPGLQVIH